MKIIVPVLEAGCTFAFLAALAGCNSSSVSYNPGGSGSGITAPGGNVYVADQGTSTVKELLAPAYTTVKTIGTKFCNPQRIALDRSGNVFVPGVCANRVKEILASGGYTTVKTLASGYPFLSPVGVAVDASDNVFVVDDNGFETGFHEILAAGGYSQVKTFGSGFNHPVAIAVDGSDNVFVTDSNDGLVKEVLAASGYQTINAIGGTFRGPSGITVDRSGNVFVGDGGDGTIKEILAPRYTTANSIASGFTEPQGLAVDSSGNVYVAAIFNPVEEILAVGGSVPSSPQIVTLGSGIEKPSGIAVQHP